MEEKPGVGNRRPIVDNVDGKCQNERYDAAHARFLITPEQLENPQRVLSTRRADCFERAALWSVSDEGGEFNLARYQARRFESPFEHQCSCVAADIAERKFHGARERDGVSFAPAPLCLRRTRGLYHPRSGQKQQESAFSGSLSIKAQCTTISIRERSLYLPTADHVERLCLGQAGAACLGDGDQNQVARNEPPRMSNACS